jgi:uncharacterized protein (TIGR01244 family)
MAALRVGRAIGRWGVLAGFSAAIVAPIASHGQVTKEVVPGITNFARVETTVACGGATQPDALPRIKAMGFASVINLRLPTETGAGIDAESAAAKEAGLRFVHLPFNSGSPDPAVVDRFLVALADPANQPAFIHCASGNRASALWMIKRVLVDKWDLTRAAEEAAGLGLTSAPLKQFALDYIETHRK